MDNSHSQSRNLSHGASIEEGREVSKGLTVDIIPRFVQTRLQTRRQDRSVRQSIMNLMLRETHEGMDDAEGSLRAGRDGLLGREAGGGSRIARRGTGRRLGGGTGIVHLGLGRDKSLLRSCGRMGWVSGRK
jgi:hypothetical protein